MKKVGLQKQLFLGSHFACPGSTGAVLQIFWSLLCILYSSAFQLNCQIDDDMFSCIYFGNN